MTMKRIIASIGVVILALLYIATLISAIFTTPSTPQLFKACLYATVVVPVLFYGYLLIYKVIKQRSEDADRELNDTFSKMSEASATDDSQEVVESVDDK